MTIDSPPLEDYLDISQLKTRGWTRALIASFLGQPDHTHRCAAGGRPAGLYLLWRVAAAESTVAWLRAQATARSKAATAQAAASVRRLDLLRYAERLELRLPPWTFDELLERAAMQVSTVGRGPGRDATLRHRVLSLALEAFADADARLDIYEHSAGIRDARVRLMQRKLLVVADRYPALAPLCRGVFPEGSYLYVEKKAA